MYGRYFISALWDRLAAHFVTSLLPTHRSAATLRRWSLILIGGALWAAFAFWKHPYTSGIESLRSIVEYPFRALFAPDVFKHVLVGAVVFWLAYRIAAIYLDDIFDLRNVPVAERFIRQAAFASRYDVIEIYNGDVAERDKLSPIFLIGGPGKVRVSLENAALFEMVGGRPRMIGPTLPNQPAASPAPSGNGRVIKALAPAEDVRLLEGFERLRSVVDLREQVETFPVFGITRDGLPIRAENVMVIFSVLRDGQTSTLERPYPFSELAVRDLVYSERSQGQTLKPAMRLNWGRVMVATIQREFGNFIAKHTLSEFMAAIGWPEVDQARQVMEEVQRVTNELAGVEEPVQIDLPPPQNFVPRDEISQLFSSEWEAFQAELESQGLELRWIGVGTWVPPAEVIAERHLQAWRITYENLARGSQVALDNLRQESRLEQLLVLIRDTPLGTYHRLNLQDEGSRTANMAALVNTYRDRLVTIREIYRQKAETSQGDEREKFLQKESQVNRLSEHLFDVVTHHLGDRGHGSD
jgi:hypothetical protein